MNQVPRPLWLVGGTGFMFITYILFLTIEGEYIVWLVSVGSGIGYGIIIFF